MKANSFGLDIGTTTIKAVWLGRDNGKTTYHSSTSVPTPSHGMQSESPFDQQELAQLINKMVVDAKIATTNVNIALPENAVFTKVLDMPVLSDKELANAIYWEAEQNIPAQLDTMNLDWSVLKRPKDALSGQKMQVLLVAAPIKLVKKYQTVLELAGLNVMAVETEVISVIRGIIANENIPTTLIMNIGALYMTLSIVQNGVIVFTYSMTLGSMALTRAIAADFGFTPAQAEEYKKVYGLADKNLGGKVGKAIEPILAQMVIEVKKALAFYAEKYKNEHPITQIFLSGGGAGLPGLSVYLAQNLGIETVIANPWKMLSVQNVPQAIENRGPEFSVAVGLALKEYE